MIFSQFRFLAFFLAVFLVYWSLRSNRNRKLFLLLCSYAFYSAWDWRFLSLIWISTGVDYIVGCSLPGAQDSARRKTLLLISLGVNLGLLATFKYFGFFLTSAESLLQFLGFQFNMSVMKILLPVGISFYTFQTLSYTIDVYRRRLQPVTDLPDFALFVAFFPQLVAGPIVRASEFLPQLSNIKRYSKVNVRACLVLFLLGFVKKACVADNLAPAVEAFFNEPMQYNWLSTWMALIGFGIQVYGDFAGYSNMAIACAGLLGYNLGVNFAHPWLSASMGEFWRRWHISLSTWLRDYLYIPLGGSRCSPLRNHFNLIATMTLGGLWHGAAWTFVLWGFMHGLALSLERSLSLITGLKPGREDKLITFRRLPGILWVWWWMALTFIVFRSADMQEAWLLMKPFLTFQSWGDNQLSPALLPVFAGLLAIHSVTAGTTWKRIVLGAPRCLFAAAYGAVFALAVATMRVGYNPFIYFQF